MFGSVGRGVVGQPLDTLRGRLQHEFGGRVVYTLRGGTPLVPSPAKQCPPVDGEVAEGAPRICR